MAASVHVVGEQSSCFCKFCVSFEERNTAVTGEAVYVHTVQTVTSIVNTFVVLTWNYSFTNSQYVVIFMIVPALNPTYKRTPGYTVVPSVW